MAGRYVAIRVVLADGGGVGANSPTDKNVCYLFFFFVSCTEIPLSFNV
jgi:hypothetical protein